jgi:hypothetical protein
MSVQQVAVRRFSLLLIVGIVGVVFFLFLLRPSRPDEKKTFACAINCMDGRVQDPVKDYLQQKYGVTYVDMVTEAGPGKILAENKNLAVVENIKKRVEISFRHHGAKILVIVAHHGCAGDPTSKEQQVQHLRGAKQAAESFGFGGQIILLWVDETWHAHEV